MGARGTGPMDGATTARGRFVTLDRLLKRLHANKAELLMVLERPEIPLHRRATASARVVMAA
jgi:hypothetical protein